MKQQPKEIVHDCTPDTYEILAYMNSNLDREVCICELVDNAFDAEARAVTITFSGDAIVVDDNGKGHHSVMEIIKLGQTSRGADAGMRSGRYGVGFKDATIKLADVVEVDGRTKEARSRCRVDWRSLLESGRWEIRGEPATLNMGAPTGVRVTMSRLRDGEQWTPNAIAKLVRHLGATYLPGLREGRRIVVRPTTGDEMEAEAPEDPELEHAQEIEGAFAEGMYGYEGRAGLIADEGDPGIFVYYGFRKLQEVAAPKGASRFRANIFLTETRRHAWELTRNKTGLASQRQRSALIADIAKRCEAIIERARVEPWVLKGLSLIDGAPTHARQDPPKERPASEEEAREEGYEPSTPGRKRKPRTLEDGKRPVRGGVQIIPEQRTDRDRLGSASSDGQIYVNMTNRFVANAWEEREANESNLASVAADIIVETARESNDPELRKRLLGDLADLSDADLAKVAKGRLLDVFAAQRSRRRRKKDEDAA